MAELWEHRKPGKPRAFNSPEEMYHRAIDYFKWCKEKMILEDKLFHHQGEVIHDTVYHERAMTQAGLCAFLNIGVSTWHDYKTKHPEYSEVTAAIEDVMFDSKFSGAAAGIFNANIIARDLGLADKTEMKFDNASVTPWDKVSEGD